jgi:hypothetical protein
VPGHFAECAGRLVVDVVAVKEETDVEESVGPLPEVVRPYWPLVSKVEMQCQLGGMKTHSTADAAFWSSPRVWASP